MSQNVFYADLDVINKQGVLVTGHGKGIVNNNNLIQGEYFSNDMIRLELHNDLLYGYQGYVLREDNELLALNYGIYLYDSEEQNQPSHPVEITVDDFLALSKHNIKTGEAISLMFNSVSGDAYGEYCSILKNSTNILFFAIPFTDNENIRAKYIQDTII